MFELFGIIEIGYKCENTHLGTFLSIEDAKETIKKEKNSFSFFEIVLPNGKILAVQE